MHTAASALETGLARALAAAQREPDPIARAAALEDALAALPRLTAALGAARRDAVTQARATMTAADLAEQLGVTRARVYQILAAD